MMSRSYTVLFAFIFSCLVVRVTSQGLCLATHGAEDFIYGVLENTPPGSIIGHVWIAGSNSEVSLTQYENAYFQFNNVTRNVTLIQELNTDQNASAIPALVVICVVLNSSDSGPHNVTVRIIVYDWNDNTPVFNQSHHHTNISEDTAVGTTVYTDAIASDNDQKYRGNSRIMYGIVQDNLFSEYFQIPNPTIPAVVVNRKLDYELYKQMTILIIAQDSPEEGRGPVRSATATLTVDVFDADDQDPEFSAVQYRGSITEDAQPGTPVAVSPALFAYDKDTLNASIVYEIYDPSELFEIDSITGTVSTMNLFYGDMQTVTVVIIASQADNQLRETFALLTITINAANINAPKFSKQVYQVGKLELEPVGSILVTTTATDIDFGTMIEYAIVENLDDITVDGNGSLILRQPLDYELQQERILHVTASDGSNTATTTVIIDVVDVNDNNPVFDPVQTDILIAREQGRLVTIVTATDADFNDVIVYSLENYQNLFSINNDGELYVTATEEQLTREEYTLLVSASDNRNPPRKDFTAVTVNFPPLGFTLPPPTRTPDDKQPPVEQETDNMITIVLGALAGLLLIVIVILVIVLIIRQRRMKEALNRARIPKGFAAKGLTYRQAESPDDLPKMDLHYAEDTDGTSEYDGATTIQENPLNDEGVNEGYLQSSVSDQMDREVNEIEIETAVVPYDDDFGYSSNRTKYSGHIRTFQGDDSTSSGSAQSDSTGGSRRVLVNGDNKNGGSKLTSWDSEDKIHPQGTEKLLEHGLPNKQKGEKPEITVYF